MWTFFLLQGLHLYLFCYLRLLWLFIADQVHVNPHSQETSHFYFVMDWPLFWAFHCVWSQGIAIASSCYI